jgi:uncharacterized protein (TIGR03067 family)
MKVAGSCLPGIARRKAVRMLSALQRLGWLVTMVELRKWMMIQKIFVLLLVAGQVLAADSGAEMSKEDLIRQDYERLTGTFRMVSGVIDGKEVPEDVRGKTVLVTDHNKFTVSDGGAAGTSADGTFTIDPTRTPKTVDSLQGSGPDKGKTVLGIYEVLDDNRKRACWAPAGKPRPTSFTSGPGSGHILQVWERTQRH